MSKIKRKKGREKNEVLEDKYIYIYISLGYTLKWEMILTVEQAAIPSNISIPAFAIAKDAQEIDAAAHAASPSLSKIAT